MPIFRLDKAFGIGRDIKVFLSAQGGLTRGIVPDPKHYEKQVKKLRNRMREQRNRMREQRKEQVKKLRSRMREQRKGQAKKLRSHIREQRKMLGEQRKMLKRKDQRIKEQSETLRNERQLYYKQRKRHYQQKIEIFRLKNKLNAISEPVEDARDIPPYPHEPGEPEIGALPDFVVIGAMRCGTSKFYELLTQHPNVERAARKEVHYFDSSERLERDIEWYRQCFPPPKWRDGRRSITGEATPSYLPNPLAPKRMAQVVPEARLIVLLRNPVDRAYSHYNLQIRRGEQTRTFEEVIEEEQALLLVEGDESSKYDNLLGRGIYVDQLLRWSRFFDDEQMLVLKSEDFYRHTTGTLKLVQNFLDLPFRKPDLPPYKRKYSYEHMDPTTRQRLEAYFNPHNQRLYEYLGVNFRW